MKYIRLTKEQLDEMHQEFINFLQYRSPNSNDEALDSNVVEKLLSNFIGEKLISQEIEDLQINSFISPNNISKIEFIATKNGEFTYYCTVFCGEGHAFHKGILIVK